nr:Gag-Pol polyprotein [Tanacetum cinerariifolium]
MLVQAQADMDEASIMPSAPQHTPSIIQPTTSKPHKKQNPKKPRRQDPKETQPGDPITNLADEALSEENVPTQSNDLSLSRVNTLESEEDRLKLKELMELYTKLSERVLNLETTKTAQAKEISRLKNRVKRLENKKKSRTHELKRLYKVGLSARVESSDEESLGEEDASKQRRKIADIGANKGQQAKEVVADKDLIDDITLAKALMEIKATSAGTRPKAKSIVMQEPSETPTTTTIPISLKVQDKGKCIMVEEPLKMKKKDQISFDEQKARRLQAEINEQDRLAEEKAQQIEDENLTWDNVQAMIDADYELAESKMLKNCDREDLEVLWRLVKGRFVKINPLDGMDSFIMHTLKTMFEHHVEDTVWKSQQGLTKNPGVHNVGNQNGLSVDPGITNQYGIRNVVTARAEGNGDLEEIQKVNEHCILMANLQQASTSGTQSDKAPVYDSDESAEEIPNLNNQLSKEKSTISSLQKEKKRLKSDFKIREGELLDKQIQLENKIKELDNILVKTSQSIQTMHMLSSKTGSFYHNEHKMALGYQNPFYLKQAQQKQQSLDNGKVLLEKHDPPAVRFRGDIATFSK